MTEDEKRACKNLRRIWDEKKEGLGLTQEKAAAALEVTQGAVGHFLTGRKPLNIKRVIGFAKMLRVDPQDIDPSQPITFKHQQHGGQAQQRLMDLLSSGFASGALSDRDAEAIEAFVAGRLSAGTPTIK